MFGWLKLSENCNFSFKHYEECLNDALGRGYKFLKFNEINEAEKYDKVIFMRHDVDMNVDHALKFAAIENKHGISSTFFIRVCGKYNAWNINTFYSLMKMLSMGHEIGLHYEPDFSVINGRNLAEDIVFHKLMLEKLLKIEIKSICPHEPKKTNSLHLPHEINKELGNMLHAYDDFFFNECKYISDSSSRWREGCMHEFIERETKKLCILTHPIWWFDKSPIENY